MKLKIATRIRLRWADFERRWIKIPYKLRAITDRYLTHRLPLVSISDNYDAKYIEARVNYYNKLNAQFVVQNQTPFTRLKSDKRKFVRSNYYVIDIFHLLAGMRNAIRSAKLKGLFAKARFDFLFGDITYVPSIPTIVKSRPIDGDNRNSVVLSIEWLRHFRFVNDPLKYEQKKNCAVWRGAVKTNPKRRQLLIDKYRKHPNCNVADLAKREGIRPLFAKTYMEVSEQLKYKFIISVEGVDVASNLKWIMSSNSLCIAQKLKYETWFMEGKLIPNFHYAQVADDFSDLSEKIKYYLANPDKAKAIIANQHAWASQFMDVKREEYIGRRVLLKYFELSGQIAQDPARC